MSVKLRRTLAVRAALVSLVILTAAVPVAAMEPHGGMLRYPDVSASHIVSVYANDLWVVPREGGTAIPLASPPGAETFPRFNAAGDTVAFMGNYDGNTDLYTIPTAGGTPLRVTYHPDTEHLSDWTPDGRLLFSAAARHWYPRARELFAVSASGGLPEKMPVPYGSTATVSADGTWLAYTPHTRDHRTWKRYRGGMATDLWLFNLDDSSSRKITDWEGTDTLPMWQGDTVYYLSDARSDTASPHRLNIWAYDTASGERRQVTRHEDFDVKWPAIGPGPEGRGEIVYQLGSELRLLDLASGESTVVSVTIPGARPKLRTRPFDVAGLVRNQDISPTGQRAIVEARGDVWTLPAEKGSPRNLTRTSGAAERNPVWSPDGRWIAYFSDATGEYQLYVMPADGSGDARRLTDTALRYVFQPAWSPDSESIAFWDQSSTLWIADAASGELTRVAKDHGLGTPRVSWSHDSAWLAFTAADDITAFSRIVLYDVAADEAHKVTAGYFNDSWPTFDREGEFLYFASQREFTDPIYEDNGTTWVYTNTDRLYAVPLRADVPSPMLPESDEETPADEADGEEGEEGDGGNGEGGEDGEDGDDGDDEPEPLAIDLDGFEERAFLLPSPRGNFGYLAVNDEGHLLYSIFPLADMLGGAAIRIVDAGADEEPDKLVLDGATYFRMSADGKKILAVSDSGPMAILDARAGQSLDSPVPTAGMTANIDPREEWRQIFHEAWRQQRDFFYDPNMHGVDWDAVRAHYAPMIEDATSREDVSYVIREMISEINVGHAYYFGGDHEEEPNVSVGMLGVDWELDGSVDGGAYRIAAIVEGGPWDVDARGPLSQPGVDAAVGDYLLAVNGVPVDTSKDPWAAFQGLAGSIVTLTLSDEPTLDDAAREVVVEPLGGEYDLRYRRWVEASRRYVEERTEGRVGYIYVPNTGVPGQNELVRQFWTQRGKPALIIDERWNGGGQIPTRFVELLDRPVANYWSLREGEDIVWPPDAHHGPKCMLINGLAGSGGDYFPWWFREAGLGKLIGMRTWGGLVGIGGFQPLIDGGIVTAPNFAFYEKDGTWGIEGHGVEPDIEVVDDPALMVDGADPQLDAAIALMLDELETNPYTPPTPPAFPDRSGMGITAEDH